MTPREPPAAGPTLGPAHGGHRTQPRASPSLCASIIRFSSGERPGSVPPWLPMDISAPSHVLIPVVPGSPSPQGRSGSRQGKGLEGSVPSLILGCGNGRGHVGLLQGQPSLSPGLLCSSRAQLHMLEPLTLVLAVTAIPLSWLPAGAAGLCWPRGLNCAVATARVLLGQWQRGKEGERGGAQPCGAGMGRGSRVSWWQQECGPASRPLPASAAQQQQLCRATFWGPGLQRWVPQGSGAAQFTPVLALGAARGPVSHRGQPPCCPTPHPSPSVGISPPAPAFPPH